MQLGRAPRREAARQVTRRWFRGWRQGPRHLRRSSLGQSGDFGVGRGLTALIQRLAAIVQVGFGLRCGLGVIFHEGHGFGYRRRRVVHKRDRLGQRLAINPTRSMSQPVVCPGRAIGGPGGCRAGAVWGIDQLILEQGVASRLLNLALGLKVSCQRPIQADPRAHTRSNFKRIGLRRRRPD